MKQLIVITGPQGSGNHLFSRVFALSPEVYGWSSLLHTVWQGHHEEPFALCWQDPDRLHEFDWTQSDTFVTSVSCPYFFNGQPTVPDYRRFIAAANYHVDHVAIGIIGRDQNIIRLQQSRVRGAPTVDQALEQFDYLFDNYHCEFLSQEMLYLYREQYVRWIERRFAVNINTTRLEQILAEDANAKYVAQAIGKLDQHIISSSKNSFRSC